MGQGIQGMRRCTCRDFDVWGVACKAPYKGTLLDSSGVNQNSEPISPSYSNGSVAPYREGGRTWYAIAAKVPASYRPYANAHGRVGVGGLPLPSSALATGDSRFAVQLPWQIVRLVEVAGSDQLRQTSQVLGSRSIHRDGEQTYIAYWQQPTYQLSGQPEPGSPVNFGGVAIIDIKAQAEVGRFDLDLNQKLLDGGLTQMESQWTAPVAKGATVIAMTPWELTYSYPAPRTFCIGKRLFISSSYTPGTTLWGVGKVDLNSGLVFCSDGEVGNMNLDYSIVLPAIRSDGENEGWVCAMRKGGTPKLVVGRWTNLLLRPGSGDMNTGFADGSLTEGEVRKVILEGLEYSGLAVHCYNRVRGKDLLIVSTATPSRYYYDGTSLRPLSSGEFITMDHEDNILIADSTKLTKYGPSGNIIWSITFRMDGGYDVPPVSAVQIMPTKRWIQLRGMAGSMSDATADPRRPLPGVYWGYNGKTYNCAKLWPFNVTNWSVSHDGEVRVPHLEIMHPAPAFHITYAEALIAQPPFPPSWIGSSEAFSDKTTHSRISKLRPRSYSDTLSHLPQTVWMRELKPTGPGGASEQHWHLMKNYETTVPGAWLYRTSTIEGGCLDEDFNGATDGVSRWLGTDVAGSGDWDAVDCDCKCCGCDHGNDTGW